MAHGTTTSDGLDEAKDVAPIQVQGGKQVIVAPEDAAAADVRPCGGQS